MAEGNIDLIFIGDSITHAWENAGKAVWAKHFAKRNAVNLGISGDRTQHVLWRMDNGNVKNISPKVAVVMIGTNNSGEGRNTAEEMIDGVTAVVDKLHAKLPKTKVLLLDIFPRGQRINAQRGKILQVNQVLSRLDKRPNVTFLRIGQSSSVRTAPSPRTSCRTFSTSHPRATPSGPRPSSRPWPDSWANNPPLGQALGQVQPF